MRKYDEWIYEELKCPKCRRECMIEFENEKGYKLR